MVGNLVIVMHRSHDEVLDAVNEAVERGGWLTLEGTDSKQQFSVNPDNVLYIERTGTGTQ